MVHGLLINFFLISVNYVLYIDIHIQFYRFLDLHSACCFTMQIISIKSNPSDSYFYIMDCQQSFERDSLSQRHANRK